MRIFAISDLHLSLFKPKEMSVFGAHWDNHWDRIRDDWRARVGSGDAVLVAGDISWAMHYSEFEPDIASVNELPGRKVLLRGNHDYWHCSLTKTRAYLAEGTFFLQNDCIDLGEVSAVGSRGWIQSSDNTMSADDEKIYRRELERLKLSLEAGRRIGKPMIGMMHFPPFSVKRGATGFTELFAEYGVKQVVYGHIHGDALRYGDYSPLTIGETTYILTSCDSLGFRLLEIKA